MARAQTSTQEPAAAASSPAAAKPANGNTEAVTKRIDPTDFRTRFELRTNLQEQQSGGYRTRLIPRLEYAFTKQLSLRLETPLVAFDPRTEGMGSEAGLGDVVARVSYRAARGQSYAVVTALEATFPSASNEALGTEQYLLSPLAFASIDIPGTKSNFFPGVQHVASVGNNANGNDIHYTQFRTVLLSRWPKRIYTVVDGQWVIDWKRDNDFGLVLEAEVGHFLTRNVAFWVRPGVGLAGDNLPTTYNWNIEVGFRYLFD